MYPGIRDARGTLKSADHRVSVVSKLPGKRPNPSSASAISIEARREQDGIRDGIHSFNMALAAYRNILRATRIAFRGLRILPLPIHGVLHTD